MVAMAGAEEEREGANQTLEDVLVSKSKVRPQFVRPRHTVREAASVMAMQNKAVLVVEEGELMGIFTPKDVMNRVITKVCLVRCYTRAKLMSKLLLWRRCSAVRFGACGVRHDPWYVCCCCVVSLRLSAAVLLPPLVVVVVVMVVMVMVQDPYYVSQQRSCNCHRC